MLSTGDLSPLYQAAQTEAELMEEPRARQRLQTCRRGQRAQTGQGERSNLESNKVREELSGDERHRERQPPPEKLVLKYS